MRRRDFLSLLGGSAAAAWPLAARAQQPALPVIGLLATSTLESNASRIAAFREGLKETGFVEGQNVTIEYRSADGQREALTGLVADLVRRQVSVIVATGGSDPARAAKAATSTIPIVFAYGGDPVVGGLVATLSRPGANLTGVSILSTELQAKQLEMLRDLLPKLALVAYLQNPMNFASETDARDMQAAARALGCQIVLFKAAAEPGIGAAFADIAQRRFDALVVQPEPLFNDRRAQIVGLAAQLNLPAIYPNSEYVSGGGLMSYSADIKDAFRQTGLYTGRVLKGEKPANLPVLLPTKFELAINLKTAKTLGLTFPQSFQLRADEVIE
jgi:putative ABC transport system substrate-binding protein